MALEALINLGIVVTNVSTGDVGAGEFQIPLGGQKSLPFLPPNTWPAIAQGFLTVAAPANNIITTPVLLGATGPAESAVAAIATTTSPQTYTNNDGVPELVVWTGGTVTAVQWKRGAGAAVTTGVTAAAGSYYLFPGDSLVFTYTGAPTFTKYLTAAGSFEPAIYNSLMNVIAYLSTHIQAAN